MRAPHLDRIMKLLLLSGRGNPNVHERAAAKEKAEAIMARHGVTLEHMRDLYRQELGLPPKAGAGGSTRGRHPRPGSGMPANRPRPMTPEDIFQLLKDTIEEQKLGRERFAMNLRGAIDAVLSDHQDFAEFLVHLAAQGIRVILGVREPLDSLMLRWPPSPWQARLDSLGPNHGWPALLCRGLRFDPSDPRHQQALRALARR